MKFDPVRVGLFAELFASIAEEMGSVIERTSFSPNIKERRDYSCAIFSPDGDLIAQAAHIPVHLGAMQLLIKKWLAEGPAILPGKIYVTNDPFFAGTHLPDVSVLRGVFLDGKTLGYVCTRAHHADIGGNSPGSIAPAKSIIEEGITIAPQEFTDGLLLSARAPEERMADLRAQVSSANLGARRFADLHRKFADELSEKIKQSLEYANKITESAIARIPDGEYGAADGLEDVPGGAEIRLNIRKSANKIEFDFHGTDEQNPIGINATEAVTRSACYYVVRCLAPDAPSNSGCWRSVAVRAPLGTLVNAQYPAPVAGGNTETSQRIVDVILQALNKSMPDVIPSCSQGTMNNLAFGTDEWAYYETIAGGAGAGPRYDGADGVHSHMTNTRNTPIEALELELPLRIVEYRLRSGSGGFGRHRGGDGVIRAFQALEDGIQCSFMTDRRKKGPPGDPPGMPGRNSLDGRPLPSKGSVVLDKGSVVRIETPGGGGWNLP